MSMHDDVRLKQLEEEINELKFKIGQEEWRGEPELYERMVKAESALAQISDILKEHAPYMDDGITRAIRQIVDGFQNGLRVYKGE